MLTTRIKGKMGEEIACNHLLDMGFLVQERNYLKKWGEIDIITTKDGILHFFEVKSSTNTNENNYRPEENVHNLKVRRLKRTIQTYLNERKYGNDIEFKFHIIVVKFDLLSNKETVNILENIIL
jgi:putative endonuclease